jgi:excisionase family DNA binding protein
MTENQSVEQRLDTIERLLKGQKSVLTFEEGCEFTGLSKSYMYKLTHRNQVPFFKPHGKNIYFSREELEAWLLKNPVKTAEAVEQEAANYVALGKRRK